MGEIIGFGPMSVKKEGGCFCGQHGHFTMGIHHRCWQCSWMYLEDPHLEPTQDEHTLIESCIEAAYTVHIRWIAGGAHARG